MTAESDLFGGPEGDEEGAPSPFFKLLGAAEERLGGRARGRPPGARNRKSADFEKWYYAAGFKDPAQLLAEIVSADPLALARVAHVPLGEAIDLQRKAAVDLMPYLHGKKPTELVVTDERLPVLIIAGDQNQLDQARQLIEERKALSIGSPVVEGEAKEINDLEGEQ